MGMELKKWNTQHLASGQWLTGSLQLEAHLQGGFLVPSTERMHGHAMLMTHCLGALVDAGLNAVGWAVGSAL